MSTPSQLSETDFEVEAQARGQGGNQRHVCCSRFELTFAGVFRIQNVPQESMNRCVLIECPRLLFPFAREIIATAVRNGGFPPLLLDPVDFVGALSPEAWRRCSRRRATGGAALAAIRLRRRG